MESFEQGLQHIAGGQHLLHRADFNGYFLKLDFLDRPSAASAELQRDLAKSILNRCQRDVNIAKIRAAGAFGF